MKKKSQLQKIQLRLTIIFTMLVFGIASILQVSYFTYKYYSGIKDEVMKIKYLSDTINQKNIPLTQLQKILKNERYLGVDEKNQTTDSTEVTKGKIMNYAILDENSHVLLQNIRGEVNIAAVMNILQSKNSKISVRDGTIVKYLAISRPSETFQLLLFKQLNYDFEELISDIGRFFLVITLFSIFVFFIGYIFVKRNLKPVEKNILEMKDFIHNAGHELKTPISVIDSNLQLMKQLGVYNEDMIRENIGEISRLNKLIEALVTIADVQKTENNIENKIDETISQILDDFTLLIEEKNINIKFIQKKNFTINSDKEYLYILLSNIIKNAIKFSSKESTINISYMDQMCVIQDFGCGIEKENVSKIFDRFFQEKGARNSEGFGIGLALVAKISQIYNWKIKVKSEKDEGTRFIINF